MAKSHKKPRAAKPRKQASRPAQADPVGQSEAAESASAGAAEGVGDVPVDVTPDMREVMAENSRQLGDLAYTESIPDVLLDDIADESIHPSSQSPVPVKTPVKTRGWLGRFLSWAFGAR